MKNIRAKKSDLVTILRRNRTLHEETFAAAILGYTAEATEKLRRKIQSVLSDPEGTNLYFSIEKPINSIAEYDRAIRMLDMEIEDTVTLSQDEFARYVDNDWEWSSTFQRVSNNYTTG